MRSVWMESNMESSMRNAVPCSLGGGNSAGHQDQDQDQERFPK